MGESRKGRHEESRLVVSDQIDWSQSHYMKNREIRGQRGVTQEVIRPGVSTTIVSHVGGVNCRVKRQVCRD